MASIRHAHIGLSVVGLLVCAGARSNESATAIVHSRTAPAGLGGAAAQSARPSQAALVLLDVSRGSLPNPNLVEVRNVISRDLVRALRPSGYFGIATLAGRLRMPAALVSSADYTPRAFKEATDVPWEERHSNVLIWDGLLAAIKILQRTPSDRQRVVILISAGKPTGNASTVDTVVDAALAAQVQIGVVFRPTRSYQQPIPQEGSAEAILLRPDLLLRDVAKRTKGVLLESRGLTESVLARECEAVLSHVRDASRLPVAR